MFLGPHESTAGEKAQKLRKFCLAKGIPVTLPCYRAMHRYRRKAVTFEKPLFPGYVFLQLHPEQQQPVLQNEDVANLLPFSTRNFSGINLPKSFWLWKQISRSSWPRILGRAPGSG